MSREECGGENVGDGVGNGDGDGDGAGAGVEAAIAKAGMKDETPTQPPVRQSRGSCFIGADQQQRRAAQSRADGRQHVQIVHIRLVSHNCSRRMHSLKALHFQVGPSPRIFKLELQDSFNWKMENGKWKIEAHPPIRGLQREAIKAIKAINASRVWSSA